MYVKGIPQLKIPIKQKDLTISEVEKYLPTIFSDFKKNAKKIREDYDIFCLNQSIYAKQRAHNDTDINNIVAIPNIRSCIEWKVGYTIGQPIKYAQTKSNTTNDIETLNRHFRSISKNTINEEEITWALVCGVGYTFIQPKVDDFNIVEEAPFDMYCIDSDRCAKVYSSYLGNKELFDIIYTTYDIVNENGIKEKVEIFDLYFPQFLYTYEFRVGYSEWKRINTQERKLYNKLPLTEKRRNSDGIGLISMGKDLADTMDKLISSGLDNIDEIVNQFFIYYNVNLGETQEERAKQHQRAKKNGVIVANGNNPDLPPKVDTIEPQLNLSEVRELYSLVNSVFHSVCGVPMETSNTNSGGTTKQGSEVANGYDNAYTRFLKDTNYFVKADYEQLSKIMWIEKVTPSNTIDTLYTYDIQIKYQPNLTDNILTKSQAFGTLIQYMPPSMALRICRMSPDPEAEGTTIEQSEIYKAYLDSKKTGAKEQIEVNETKKVSRETKTKKEDIDGESL